MAHELPLGYELRFAHELPCGHEKAQFKSCVHTQIMCEAQFMARSANSF
jgi:hypothetical protein